MPDIDKNRELLITAAWVETVDEFCDRQPVPAGILALAAEDTGYTGASELLNKLLEREIFKRDRMWCLTRGPRFKLGLAIARAVREAAQRVSKA